MSTAQVSAYRKELPGTAVACLKALMRIDEPPERVAVAIFTHLVHQWDPNVHLERRVMAIDDRAEVSWEQATY